MSPPASGDGPRASRASPSRKRKLAGLLLKLGVGLLILWVIASKLSLDDEVVLADGGKATGRDLVHDRRSSALVFTRPDGTSERIPLDEGPTLYRKGAGFQVRRHRGDREAATAARFEGRVTLETGGGPRTIDLAGVKLEAGTEDDGWVEQSPEIREGLRTIYGRLSFARYVPAFLLILATYLLGIRRWQILLGAQGIDVSYWEAARLTFIGFFFNNVVPGLTGGDLIKAIMIARAHPGRGALAVSTVIVDRVLGLLVLAAISAAFLAFHFSEYPLVATWLFLMLGSGVLCICLFLSRRVRRAVRLDHFLKKLPGADALKKLDQAFLLYRSRGRVVAWCVLLSAGAHFLNILSIYLMGMDLGVDAAGGLDGEPLVTYFAIVPTILIASSLPLLPGGWGLGEWLYASFFRTVGVTNLSLSVGLSVLTRTSTLLWSLIGGIFLFLRRKEASAAMHEAAAATDKEPAGSAVPQG